MPHPLTQMPPEAYIAALQKLLYNGYTEDVQKYTKSIQDDPEAVALFAFGFCGLFKKRKINWSNLATEKTHFATLDEDYAMLLHNQKNNPATSGHPYRNYLEITNHGLDCTFETGLICNDKKSIWNRWTGKVADPAMTYAEMSYPFEVKHYRSARKPAEKPEPPLYRYHPERFRAYRDYPDSVVQLYRQQVDAKTGMLTLEQLDAVEADITAETKRLETVTPVKWIIR